MIITKSEPYTKGEAEKARKHNKVILESLASDLKRVCLGLERGAFGMALRFEKEALKRKEALNVINSRLTNKSAPSNEAGTFDKRLEFL